MTEKMKCPLCGSTETKIRPGGYTGCAECGGAFMDTGKGLSPASPAENNELVYHQSKKRIFAEGLNDIEKLTGGRKGTLLDIGCGHGYFMKLASDEGWKVEGIEISDSAAEYAKSNFGFTVHTKQLGELGLSSRYDVVTLWTVLDVLPSPLEELKEIYRILKPGGILFLRINNFSFHRPALRLGETYLFRKLKIKPGIMQRWGITGKTLVTLLRKAEFCDIKVYNSRMTSGDPYGSGGILGGMLVSAVKNLYFGISQIIFILTLGKQTISSSIIAAARKQK